MKLWNFLNKNGIVCGSVCFIDIEEDEGVVTVAENGFVKGEKVRGIYDVAEFTPQ